MVVLLWSAPAHAQAYSDILGEEDDTAEVFDSEVFTASESEATATGGLARTGQSNIAPMVQGGLVLLGAGALLVIVARRRQPGRHAAV